MKKLSSGLRINHAGDDAAGLAISSSLKTDSRVFTQAIRNINDGLSSLAIGQSALEQLGSISERQMELGEQAANGVYNRNQRLAMQTEVNSLAQEFNRIVQSTSFNGRRILMVDDNNGTLQIQAGSGNSAVLSVDVGSQLARTVGTGTVTLGATYAGTGIHAIQIGDFNNDGRQDILSFGGSNRLDLNLNNGKGTFATVAVAPNYVVSGTMGDFNGDGNLDFTYSDNGYIGIELGNGNGTFRLGQTISTSGYGFQTSADFNGDGRLDIAYAGTGDSVVHMALGNGNGTFAVSSTSYGVAGTNPFLAAGDINGDGNVDLVTSAYYMPGGSNVLLGTGRGSFSQILTYNPGGWLGQGIVCTDFNNDGYDDILNFPATGGDFVSLSNGNGTFKGPLSLGIGGGYGRAVAADINGYGYQDVISTDASNVLSIALNNGNGTFATTITTATANSMFEGIAAGDLNGDGIADIATANYDSGNNEILLSNTRRTALSQTFNLTNQSNARQSLVLFQQQRQRVSSEMGNIGAFQSRLGFAVNELAAA